MDRRVARAVAMKLIYEWELGGDGGEETLVGMLDVTPGEKECDYVDAVVAGVKANVDQLDAQVAKHAVGWTLERIHRVDLSILRLAIYEVLHTKVPSAAAASEAVELARTYSTPEAASFINGVIGQVIREAQE